MDLMTWIAAVSFLLALVPALLFLRNLSLYLPPPLPKVPFPVSCSVLIPARNEELNIAGALFSVLQNQISDLEVLVLDDDSTDQTAQIVHEISHQDKRVRLVPSLPLPPGWCGKQHACHLLARQARHPLLVFMDADVRLKPDALMRMAAFLDQTSAALASGVPEQVTQTFSEKLLIPLIHFILLGFLPIKRMRSTRDPAFGAGCGQLFIARREEYHASGGHSAIRATLHDGPKLARAFRAAGFATDLFDATAIAACRMYSSDAAVWQGLGKNAGEGLGSPRLIGPSTLILFGGQVLPVCLFLFLLLHPSATSLAFTFSILGTVASFLPRLLAALRFRQPLSGALLHPLGICALLSIQWFALFSSLRQRPSIWKGRSYSKTLET